MRPATCSRPTAPNLYNAVAVAADPEARGRGAIVVLNDDLHSARDVTKSHTSDVQAFALPAPGSWAPRPTAASATSAGPRGGTPRLGVHDQGLLALPRVDILYAHAGMSPDLVAACVERGARGLVIAGMGNGNVTREAAEALAERSGREWPWCAARGS